MQKKQEVVFKPEHRDDIEAFDFEGKREGLFHGNVGVSLLNVQVYAPEKVLLVDKEEFEVGVCSSQSEVLNGNAEKEEVSRRRN